METPVIEDPEVDEHHYPKRERDGVSDDIGHQSSLFEEGDSQLQEDRAQLEGHTNQGADAKDTQQVQHHGPDKHNPEEDIDSVLKDVQEGFVHDCGVCWL